MLTRRSTARPSVANGRDASAATNTQAIVVDTDAAKLYLASTPTSPRSTTIEALAVLDLDANGEPQGPPRPYDTGMPYGSVYALAKDPTRPRLYGGYGDVRIYVVTLDAGGEPIGHAPLTIDQVAPVAGVGVADLVVSPDGRFLYVGGVDLVETYALEGDGARRVGVLPLPAAPEGAYPYTRLALAGGRLARRGGGFPPSPGATAPYQTMPLIDGVPTIVQVDAQALVDVVGGRNLFPVFDLAYVDTYTGQRVVADLQLGVSGPSVGDRAGVRTTAFGDGTPVVLTTQRYAVGSRQRDLKIRARIDAVDFEGVPLTDVSAVSIPQIMVIGSDFYEAPQVTLGQMSDWVTLDRALLDRAHSMAGYISVAGAPTRVVLSVEVALGDTSLGTPSLASEGPDVLVRVPGLGLPDELLATNVGSERSVSQARATHAASVGLAPGERPTRFAIGCYSIIGLQADRVALDALAGAIASLGCNTILPISWSGLPDEVVRTTLAAHGVTRRGGSTYAPPSYFDFETAAMSPTLLATWADEVPDNYADPWSYRLDVLRSATMASPRAASGFPMGAYVVPSASGQMLEGMSYKVLSLLGRGGKVVELFNFGPTSLQSDGWSDNTAVYAPIARAMRRVAKAERVMFDAVPEHDRVALLFPGESVYFDEGSETDDTFETEALHRALMHAGFRVDVLDAHGLAAGQLTNAAYDVLYIAGPNVPAAAMQAVADWVAAGGTLAVTLGGAVVDAYDSPKGTLTEVLGLAPRPRLRAPLDAPYTQRPLNWRNAPHDCLELVVGDVTGTPRSIEGRRIRSTPEGAEQRLILERLDAVDVVVFEEESE